MDANGMISSLASASTCDVSTAIEEAIETARIHSVAGVLQDWRGLVGTRPYGPPHHTISGAGLIGGAAIPRPGEVSLGHNGVAFLGNLGVWALSCPVRA